ncbi:MAG: response regulator, partial [Myxococcota bacterium]
FFTTKAVGQGTGMGLASCYGIIKQAGGHIGASSVEGEGTSFEVFLPVVEGPNHPSGVESERNVTRRRVVLLVEDDEMVQESTVKVLERAGYRVYSASSGEQALRLPVVRRGHLDLLVTDIVMPGMSGKELADQLGAAHPTLRVLFVSGYTDEDLSLGATHANGTAFLAKPFTIDLLVRKLDALLETSSSSKHQ